MKQQPENHEPETEQLWRANTYGLLATFLAAPPDAEALSRLAQLDMQDDSEATAAIEVALYELAKHAGELDRELIDEEFNVLFIGVTRGEIVPYGSWYQSGFMMDRPVAKLRSALATLGYERREGVYESEDHVAALCDVMRGLITESDSDLDKSLAIQREFYKEHVSVWISNFFQDLLNAQHANFYRSLSTLGLAFITLENEYLKMND
jgi:TorA maturation chaperone TorD